MRSKRRAGRSWVKTVNSKALRRGGSWHVKEQKGQWGWNMVNQERVVPGKAGEVSRGQIMQGFIGFLFKYHG